VRANSLDRPERCSAARIAAAGLALLTLVLFGSAARAQVPPQGPPPAVTVAPVRSEEIRRSAEFIGRMEAIQSVSIQARVEGFLQQVAFKEGQDVHAGDLLYVIEPDQYQAALQSAQAQLKSAQANLTQAERNLARNQELRQHGTVAQATLDQAIQQRDAASGSVMAAQAAVKTAQLNLGYTRITSPIDGRIGATSVTAGNLVGPSSGVLARVVQLDPIRVVFSVNERDLLALKQQNGNVSQQQLNARFVPTLRLADGATYAQAGRVDFVDNTVDPATGTVAVHAIFPNQQKLLLPGMLVTVTVQPEHPQTSILVPLDAVAQDRQGKFVLVVDDNDRVQQQRIEVNGQYNQQWIVTAGLREGEEVIVSGLQKVRPGQQVKPIPAEKPVGQ
jgi:membrane fusion protein (multidrug efflux system)